jgi:hypothetical protein
MRWRRTWVPADDRSAPAGRWQALVPRGRCAPAIPARPQRVDDNRRDSPPTLPRLRPKARPRMDRRAHSCHRRSRGGWRTARAAQAAGQSVAGPTHHAARWFQSLAGHRRRRPCEHETSGDRARGRDGLFASLALIPFTLAFGRCLGTSSTGPHEAASAKIEDTIVQLMTVILGPELVGDVAAPYVRAQLSQARGGLWS